MKRISILLLLASVLLSAAAMADTLELKDGSLIHGQYKGGTSTTLRFEVDGRVDVIPIDTVLAFTFSGYDSLAETAPAGTTHVGSTAGSAQERVTVPAGTKLLVRMRDSVDSKSRTGDVFESTLEADLMVDGIVVAPRASRVFGRIASADAGGRAFGKARLELQLTDIEIDGALQPIVSSDFQLEGKSQGTLRNTALGAGLGALLDGSDGAEKGALAGLGASLLIPGKQIWIPAGTLIEFRLQHSFTSRV